MTTTLSHADFTDEQKAEWRELSDQSDAAHEAMVDARDQAARHLIHALEHPADDEVSRKLAEESAREAIAHRDEWRRLCELTRATPYGAFLSEHAARLARVAS